MQIQATQKPNQGGFTLVELLTVFSIIAILAALVFPVYKGLTDQGNATKCASNLRQWGVGYQSYMNDNDGFLPQQGRDSSNASETHWQELIAKYLVGEEKNWNQRNVLRAQHKCPGEKVAGGVVYGGNLYLDPHVNKSSGNPPPKKLSMLDAAFISPANLVLMADNYTGEFYLLTPKADPVSGGVHYGRHKKVANFLMADFHVEAASFAQAEKRGLTTKYNPGL